MIVATWATYRADCIPHKTGCRQCGTSLKFASRAYCSKRCRRTFEMNHFWHTARFCAIQKTKDGYDPERYIADGGYSDGHPKCAKCGRPGEGEVNHIVPLNGNRPHFGCCHHQSNLEALCHQCHVEETRRQRREGQIGKPRIPAATPLLDLEASA